MGEVSDAVDASADAGHAFDEVGIEGVLALAEQRHLAFFNTVADAGVDRKVAAGLFELFDDGFDETTHKCVCGAKKLP